jgi:hypothetical protein
MSAAGEARAWSKTAHGEISVARPVSGIEVLSLRSWKRAWSGSLSGVGLVIPESSPLRARVAGLQQELPPGAILVLPPAEPYSLSGGRTLAASILSFDVSSLFQRGAKVAPPGVPHPRVTVSPQLDATARQLLTRIAAGPRASEREWTALWSQVASLAGDLPPRG